MTGDHRQNHLEIVLLQPIIESSRTTKFDFLSNHQDQTVQWRGFIESVMRSRNHNFKWNYVKWVQIQFSCYTNSKWTGSIVLSTLTMGHYGTRVLLEPKKTISVFAFPAVMLWKSVVCWVSFFGSSIPLCGTVYFWFPYFEIGHLWKSEQCKNIEWLYKASNKVHQDSLK